MNAPALKNELLLHALLREKTPRTPVWIMRQAGRYLPEYRETRARAGSFITLMSTPELACEVTLQPLNRFPLDAAILFSDILTIPAAMGLGLHFVEGEGPRFEHPVRDAAAIAKLGVPDPETELRYVLDAVRLIRTTLAGRVPLIGFAGSPWTLATYMVEGGSSREFSRIKQLLYQRPELLHKLLEVLARSVTQYLNAQIAAGAQAVMIFDTWGGALTPPAYREFSLQYMSAIVQGLRREHEGRRVPVVLFTKGGGPWLEETAESGCDALGVDWTQDLADARHRVGDKVALQGNLDPAALYASPEVIRDQVWKTLANFGHGNGHVFNLGHGVHADTPPDHVAAMITAVHDLSPAYHQ
ncbi:MAG TPA: uroporphyrinogen decarboxylase [Gammaproteobacteria bacterium]|nr:uroporphyrinogen decarboxylase [Gammaproteobacteria bacterium]